MYRQNMIYSIVWSPNSSDRFIKLYPKSIELYENNLNDTEETISQTYQCRKVANHPEIESIKCISWQPSKLLETNSNNDVIAIGLYNGVIKILNFGQGIYESEEYNYVEKELRTKNIKQSTFLEWNPWQRSMLAQGIDKSKGSWSNEPSVFIWDIQRESSARASGTSSQHSYHQQLSSVTVNMSSSTQYKATIEYGNDQPAFDFCRGEVVNSFAWINKRKFVVGINNKALKVFEITENQPSKVVNTDAVYGLCLNMLQQNILASFIDEKIIIWKEDTLEKPQLTYSEVCNVETIEWNPLRDGYLCVTFKDKSYVKVVDTKIALLNSSHEVEHSLIDRIIKSFDESIILAATWHRKFENCVFMYLTDDKFELVHLRSRRLASWSVQQKLVFSLDSSLYVCLHKIMSESESSRNNLDEFSNDNKTHFNEIAESIATSQEYSKNESYNFLDGDIGFVMKERAKAGYGLKPSKDLPDTTMFKDNLELRTFWKWIDDGIVNTYASDGYSSKPKINTFCGVIDCIRDVVKVAYNKRMYENMFSLNGSVSVEEEVRWNNVYDVLQYPKYVHEYRDKIFAVCGWPFNKKIETWRHHLDNIPDKERAAAIALVTLNFDLALQYLKRITNDKGIDTEMLRLCLAGFNTQSGQTSNSNWCTICRDVLKRLGNSRPYLRLIFNFLIVSNKNDLKFIKESNILLVDKIAIASLYMDDENLIEFMNTIASTHLKCGNLEAVIMTGLRSPEFIDLMQAYIDRTYDVQTAAIAVLQANILTKNALGKTKVSSQWIESYRHFLDNWSMWYFRADFDIANQYLSFMSNVETAPAKVQKPPSFYQQISKSGSNISKQPFHQSEVYVACNYCYGKISHTSKYVGSAHSTGTISRTRPDGSGYGNTTISSVAMHAGGCKATICQNCRKPLPRCSVCLMNMGTTSDSSRQTANVANFPNKDDQSSSNPILSWFIWCQKCKHGGHAGHLQSWFVEWQECPVSGCKCSCSGLDSSFALSSDFSQKTELIINSDSMP